MKKFINLAFVFVFVFAFYFSSFSHAVQYYNDDMFAASKIELEKNRIKYVQKKLGLDSALSNDFWALYKSYRAKIIVLNERTILLLKNYAEASNTNTITNEKANKFMDEFMLLDERRLMVKSKCKDEFLTKLPAKVVWRFFHIESNLDTMIDNAYIDQVPLVNL